MILSHVLHFLLSFSVTISSLISSRFTKKSFRQGANRWATVSRCRCEIITTWSTMNLLWEEISQARLECGRKMKTERAEEKREAVPASPLLRPHRLYHTLEKRNKFGTILSLSPPPLSCSLLIRPHLLKPLFSVSQPSTKLFVIMSFGIAGRDGIIITRRAMNLLWEE